MNGVERIAKERKRQVDEERWTAQHDDLLVWGELAKAAACYAVDATDAEVVDLSIGGVIDENHLVQDGAHGFPWDDNWWKPSADPIRNLEKAGALIAAEIDRLLRIFED